MCSDVKLIAVRSVSIRPPSEMLNVTAWIRLNRLSKKSFCPLVDCA